MRQPGDGRAPDRYRRSLFHYRNPRSGRPLKFATQAHYLIPVRCWFGWLLESTWIEVDVTAKLELPKEEQRLPTGVLVGRPGRVAVEPARLGKADGRT